MDSLCELPAWLDQRRAWCFDVLRVYLGLGLLVKGLLFASNEDLMATWMEAGRLQGTAAILTHYVVLAHLCGGACMAIGLLTRIAAIVQLPILIGAVTFVHLDEGLFTREQNLEFSLLVLFLLVLVAIHGGGRWSADYYLFRRKHETAAARTEAQEIALR